MRTSAEIVYYHDVGSLDSTAIEQPLPVSGDAQPFPIQHESRITMDRSQIADLAGHKVEQAYPGGRVDEVNASVDHVPTVGTDGDDAVRLESLAL
jgi:hypothetical protein